MNGIDRREALFGATALLFPQMLAAQGEPGFRLTDVTQKAGIRARHHSGVTGKKYLPETMGAGCAFLDYDGDGWQDILLVNGGSLDGSGATAPGLTLLRNNRDGTFRDATRQAGLAMPFYGMGVAVGDFNNDGFPDLYVTCLGQNRLFANQGNGTFRDVTVKAGLGKREAFSTSAAWVDFDRDGHLDLFVCNYVSWSAERDVFCSVDGKAKSYCTPEAYEGSTCWLFRNRGDGTFQDVTVAARLFDRTSKSLGVAVFDHDNDGWPDLFVANDTQPNKLYRNLRDGRFEEVGLHAGVALSEDGGARAGMGVDATDLDGSGRESLVVTNFENEMVALYQPAASGNYSDRAMEAGLGRSTRGSLGFGCFFFDVDLDGQMDLLVANGHIDETFGKLAGRAPMAQAPQLFLQRSGRFQEVGSEVGGSFASPKIARGAAYGDFDNDGDLDILLTTNGGLPHLYRNDIRSGNRSLRLTLRGSKSNRDGIGSVVRVTVSGKTSTHRVKSGSSYLSQSELPVTVGLGRASKAELVTVAWPSGRSEEFKNIAAGRHRIVEAKGIEALD